MRHVMVLIALLVPSWLTAQVHDPQPGFQPIDGKGWSFCDLDGINCVQASVIGGILDWEFRLPPPGYESLALYEVLSLYVRPPNPSVTILGLALYDNFYEGQFFAAEGHIGPITKGWSWGDYPQDWASIFPNRRFWMTAGPNGFGWNDPYRPGWSELLIPWNTPNEVSFLWRFEANGKIQDCWDGDDPSEYGCITVTPEPATWALLLTGLGCLALAYRRSKVAQAVQRTLKVGL